ncbi:hypothetical protein COV11_03465 [Candidatus Woesearchaeota archaeon CG10_big_fil_rev_8_21_14_0_10_30_7]|nr:MAG: hypothetical protein COV11_03465 [Candidatus Woesearchaeota archaeon CG10_big_fil_rev_8_21_14_0_10_30_7]
MQKSLHAFDTETEGIEIVVGGANLAKHIRVSYDNERRIYSTKSKSYASKVARKLKTYLANA